MGRKVDADDLVGPLEIAQRMNSTRRQLVSDWRRRHADFPSPVARVGDTDVWVWADVAKWARATGRL